MESAISRSPRTYQIRKSQHLGYGFIAGYEQPTLVKIVDPNGPSFQRLLPGDVIMAVNGIDVEDAPRDQIIKMIQLSQEEINIKVRQPTYEEILSYKNLASPARVITSNGNHHNLSEASQQPPPSPNSSLGTNYMPMNRLVTSIAQHQRQQTISDIHDRDIQQVAMPQVTKSRILQRTDDNGATGMHNFLNGTKTLGRNTTHEKYGRHSPLPQRCKSSMSGTQNIKTGKASGNDNDDQPMLKRSNTMRPMRPPAKILEIFEVVIRIFFEDGHTSLLKYNQDTTVGTILETLYARLVSNTPHSEQIKSYFGLTLTVNSEESSREQQLSKRKLLHVLDENDSIMKISQLPYKAKLRLICRMIYPPTDVGRLYSQDKIAFEYLYKQSCNDLRLERFSPGPDANTALKLGALHLVEYVYSNYSRAHGNSRDPKTYMKLIKRTPGLAHFVPMSMVEQTVDKKSRKYKQLKSKMTEQLKLNFDEFDFEPPKVKSTTNLNRYTSTSFHELSLPELQSSPSDYVKLMFLTYLSQLPCYGATKRPNRRSTSPMEKSSIGDCSSSLESVPRTSDSSPLLRQDQNGHHNRFDQAGSNTISRLAHMNSIRSLSTTNKPINGLAGRAPDQVDKAQTPSIESISSMTFNMQSSPSPQPTPSQLSGSCTMSLNQRSNVEPCPMPRHPSHIMRTQDMNSIEKIYHQRYGRHKPLDELLKSTILLPPPPASAILFGGFTSNRANLAPITPVLTDRDLENLKVPRPPPRMVGYH